MGAGVMISMAGLVALGAAAFVLLRRLGVAPRMAALGAAVAVAPYSVHQTAFAIRCEPLAAALAIFGLAVVAPFDECSASWGRVFLASVLFVGAFATKLTCVYGPAAAVVAFALGGRRGGAARLAAATAALGLAFFFGMNAASNGRALESFRACALAGQSFTSLFAPAALVRPLVLIATSRLLSVVFSLAVITLILHRPDWRKLPVLHFLASAAITALIFTSPGTILTSPDTFVAAIVVLTVAATSTRGRALGFGTAVLLGLAVWTAGQNTVRIVGLLRAGVVASAKADRDALVSRVQQCGSLVLSESSLIPVLAGMRPVLLDAFAFHVVSQNRPEVNHDLTARIGHRESACVALEHDPGTARGARWYRNVNLTASVVEAVTSNYVYEGSIMGQRIYIPRDRDELR